MRCGLYFFEQYVIGEYPVILSSMEKLFGVRTLNDFKKRIYSHKLLVNYGNIFFF